MDGRNYFFNTRSSAIAEISEEFLSVVNAINKGVFNEENFSKDLIDSMLYAGAIFRDDRDELMALAYQNNIFKYSQDKLITQLSQ